MSNHNIQSSFNKSSLPSNLMNFFKNMSNHFWMVEKNTNKGQVDRITQIGRQNKIMFREWWQMEMNVHVFYSFYKLDRWNKVIPGIYSIRANLRRDFWRFVSVVDHLNAWFVIGTPDQQTEEILPVQIRADLAKNWLNLDLSDWIGSSLMTGL